MELLERTVNIIADSSVPFLNLPMNPIGSGHGINISTV